MNELEDEVMRLRSRLAEAEAENLELARLIGIGSEREARLLAKLAESQAQGARLRAASESLLNFIRSRFPNDFREGGQGFSCPHHARLADALAASSSEALDAVREAQRVLNLMTNHIHPAQGLRTEKCIDVRCVAANALARVFGEVPDDK